MYPHVMMRVRGLGDDERAVWSVVCPEHVDDFARLVDHPALEAPSEEPDRRRLCLFCDGRQDDLRDAIVATWGPVPPAT